MKYKLTFIALIIAAKGIFAQAFVESQTISKSFRSNTNMTIDITNKYGKIHIIETEVDSIFFVVDYTIQSTNEMKFIKMRNSLNIDFTATQYYITAITSIQSPKSNIVRELIDLADPNSADNNMVIIDYTVYAPSNVNFEIDNKYGNVYVDNHKGSFKLDLAHGKLKANELTGKTNISIKFGDATVNKITNARLYIDYSDLYVKKGGVLNLESKSSNINIDDIKTLKIDSRRDKFHIDKIDNLTGEASFSDFWIYNFYHELNTNLKYGDLNIDLISASFGFMKIISKYTDISLIFERGSSYNLDMTQKSVMFSYPENIAKLTMKQDISDDKRFYISGTVGNKTTNISNFSINADHGSLDITHK